MPLRSGSSVEPAACSDRASHRAFATVTVLFFLWGFITCLNDLLIPKFKADFDLSQFQANLVQSAFFGAYFVVSLGYFLVSATIGDPINRIGYRSGISAGLAISGLGCLLFYPAAVLHSYPLFLGALVVLGGGVTLIQIAANPYVAILGSADSASSRLNLAQGLNSLGYVVAPLVGGFLIFGSEVYSSAGGSSIASVKAPYLALGGAFLALAVVFRFLHLPTYANPARISRGLRIFRHGHFVRGWFAIFFYVGAEVTVGSILINYLEDKGVLGLPHYEADKYLSFYWGGLMIGRLIGAVALGGIQGPRKHALMALLGCGSLLVIFANATFKQKLTTGEFLSIGSAAPFIVLVLINYLAFELGRNNPGRMTGLFGICAMGLTVLSMATSGWLALWAIIGIGLFNSIMWSNVFTLSIRDLGAETSQASSLLVMMVAGGAILPAIQGALMDMVGVRLSLAVVLIGYLYLVYFGFFGSRETSAHRLPSA